MSKYIIGKKGVIENIKKGLISKVYIKHFFPELNNLNNFYDFQIIYNKDDSFFNKFGSNHQFAIAELKEIINNNFTDYNSFINEINQVEGNKIILMLDELQDAGNFGSIIRTAESFGCLGIIYKKDNQVQINDVVVKTSAGSITNIRFLKTANLANIINKLKSNNFWIISSTLDDDSKDISMFSVDFENICLIVGNENKGVSKNLINESDLKVKIPMVGMTQSLNVSVSTGILLYYLKYQKK